MPNTFTATVSDDSTSVEGTYNGRSKNNGMNTDIDWFPSSLFFFVQLLFFSLCAASLFFSVRAVSLFFSVCAASLCASLSFSLALTCRRLYGTGSATPSATKRKKERQRTCTMPTPLDIIPRPCACA